MAIDLIHEVFPGAEVERDRAARGAKPTMTVDESTSGEEILSFLQRDASNGFRGPGVDDLKQKSLQFKRNRN